MRIASILALALALLGGCYRFEGPPLLDEPVQVVINGNAARLVQVQPLLHQAIASRLERRLGWRVSPTGSARLQIAILPEEIDVTARDPRDLPLQWAVQINGTVLLTSASQNLLGGFTGAGYLTSTVDEPEALRQACEAAADGIITWLEQQETAKRKAQRKAASAGP